MADSRLQSYTSAAGAVASTMGSRDGARVRDDDGERVARAERLAHDAVPGEARSADEHEQVADAGSMQRERELVQRKTHRPANASSMPPTCRAVIRSLPRSRASGSEQRGHPLSSVVRTEW